MIFQSEAEDRDCFFRLFRILGVGLFLTMGFPPTLIQRKYFQPPIFITLILTHTYKMYIFLKKFQAHFDAKSGVPMDFIVLLCTLYYVTNVFLFGAVDEQ